MISLNSNIGVNAYSNISKLTSIGSNEVKDTNNQNVSNAFKAIFEAASNAINEVDTLQKTSDAKTVDFITGKDDNIHSVLLAQEKALLALQFTTEVTNKALEAYNEIMRMQL